MKLNSTILIKTRDNKYTLETGGETWGGTHGWKRWTCRGKESKRQEWQEAMATTIKEEDNWMENTQG